ncbi:adhesin, partial [Paraburkholderia graminis]
MNSVAIGYGATASTDNSVALGAQSTTGADLTKLGYVPTGADPATIAGMSAKGEVSVGSQDNERRLTHVAAGADATDAVNVSQLQAATASASRYFKANGNGLNDG